jgi:hypothetical protein
MRYCTEGGDCGENVKNLKFKGKCDAVFILNSETPELCRKCVAKFQALYTSIIREMTDQNHASPVLPPRKYSFLLAELEAE